MSNLQRRPAQLQLALHNPAIDRALSIWFFRTEIQGHQHFSTELRGDLSQHMAHGRAACHLATNTPSANNMAPSSTLRTRSSHLTNQFFNLFQPHTTSGAWQNRPHRTSLYDGSRWHTDVSLVIHLILHIGSTQINQFARSFNSLRDFPFRAFQRC